MAYDPSATPKAAPKNQPSDITLDALLDEFEVSDPAVRDRVLRLAGVESSGNLNATGPRVNGGMHNGTRARGALQIMPATAKAYPQYDLNDPADASRAGLHYFLDNLNQFGGDLDAATIAHHAGPGTAKKWLREGRAGTVDRATGLSTDDYLLKVTGGKRAKPADKWWESDPVAPAEAAGNWWESDPVEPAEEPGLLERGWSALKDTFSAPSGEPVDVRPHPGEKAPAAAKPDSVMADYQGEQGARQTPANAQTRAFVQQQYDAHPEKREAMLSRPDWLGDIARQIDAEYQAMNPAESLSPFDQRREAKLERNRAQGMDPATAEMTTASQMIGGEAPVGSIKVSDFDFDLKQRYEGANPALRGAVKGYEGYKQGVLGFLQAGADLVGADFASGQFRQGAREAAGQAAAIGEGEAGARLFEGAVASLTQQLPLLIGGSIAGGQALILSGMAAQAFGQEYSEGRQAGLNGQDAATRASLFAAFEVIGEKFGLGNQLAALKMAYKGVPTKQLVAELGAALAKEIPGEVLTTTGQFLTDKAPQIGLNPEAGMAQYLSQVADTIGQTIIQGGLMMGGASAVSRGARAMQRPEPDLTAGLQFDPRVNDALARQALDPSNAQEAANVAPPLDAESYQGPGADPAGGAGLAPDGRVGAGGTGGATGAPARSGEPGVSVGETERQQVAGVVEQKIAEKEAEAAASGDPIELLVTRAEGAAMRRAVTPQPANGIDIDQDALLADVEAMFTDGGNLMVQGDNAREAVKRVDPKALASALPRGDGALLVPKRFAGPVMDALQGAKQRVSVAFGGDGMMQAPDVAQFRATVPTQEEVQNVPPTQQVAQEAQETRGQEGAASGKSAKVQTVSRQDFNVEGKDPHTISFEHKGDGRLIQTVAYPDGEVFTYTLVTDRAGDETWVSQSQYEKGEFYPRQLSSDETQAAISIALVGESATPVERQTQTPTARGQEGEASSQRFVGLAAYNITNADPLKAGDAPLSVDDALFELDVLQDRADRGKLTPDAFAQSGIAQRLDTAQMMTINDSIRAGDFSFIGALKSRIEQTQQPAQAPAVPDISPDTITPNPAPAQAKVADRPKPKNLLQIVRQAGGVSTSRIADVTGDRKQPGAVGVFTKQGMDLDGLAELLQQNGFMTEQDVSDTTSGAERATELLRQALAGERPLSLDDIDNEIALREEKKYRDRIRQRANELGIRTTARRFDAIEADVLAQEEQLALEAEDRSAYALDLGGYNEQTPAVQSFLDDAFDPFSETAAGQSTEEAMRALGFTEDEINAELQAGTSAQETGEADARGTEGGAASADPRQEGEGQGQQELDPLGFTPKQYHEAKLKWVAQEYGLPMSEVREMQDSEADRKASEQEWVNAVKQAFRDGRELTAKTLDKLEEVRPGAFNSFLHDHPAANVPQGYQTPEARQIEKQRAQERKDDRKSAKEARAKPLLQSNGKPFPSEKLAAESARQRKLDMVPVEVDGGWGLTQKAAEPLTLDAYTNADIAQREAEQTAQAEASARAEREAAAKQRQAEERAEVRRRSEAAADTFELGMDPMENLTGQSGLKFSRKQNNDAEYLAAVERGDMEAAQRMVDQAARDAGYISDTEYRMQHRAPNRESDVSLVDLRDADLVPSDYWTKPEWYQGTSEEMSAWRSVTAAMRRMDARKADGKNPGMVAITVYRAVPKGVKDGAVRNGDWVTPSREYAVNEGQMIPGGYRIIAQQALMRNLFWDGNSIAELGYDDGQPYAYRNTKNNRKLLEAVTYDDDGNVIPLSKRFNTRSDDARFSFAGQNAETADIYRLINAKERIEKGEDAERVRRETGWLRGVDGRWRFEISDDEAQLSKTDGFVAGEEYALASLLDHPKLFAAYPDLRNMAVRFVSGQSWGGQYDPSADSVDINIDRGFDERGPLSILMHEIQHAIQQREGFARGGAPDPAFTKRVKEALASLDAHERERVEQWKWGEGYQAVKKAERTSEAARYALMYESARRLMSYANHERPSSVFRLLRNEMQWIYAEDFRGNAEARDLQLAFYDMPKPSRMRARNIFLRDMASRAADLLKSKIPDQLLNEFRVDERTTKSMVAALRRQADRASKDLAPLKALERAARAAAEIKKAHEYAGPHQIYSALAGEVEARNTQARLAMTEGERRTKSPLATADVSPDQIIVMFGGLDIRAPMAAMAPANAHRTGFTRESLIQSISARFPSLTSAVESALRRGDEGQPGGVVVVERAEDLARVFAEKTGRSMDDAVQSLGSTDGRDVNGLFDSRSGLTFLVAPNLTERTAPAVLLHEATHGKQRAEIDRKAMDLIETRQARSKPLRDFLFRVEQRMDAAGESGNASEAAAYIVEEAVVAGRQAGFSAVDGKLMNWIDLKFGRRVSDIVRDFVAMIRAWAMRAGVELNPTVDDLVAIAKLNVRDMARGDVTGGEGAKESRISLSRAGQATMSPPATAAQPAQAAPRAAQAQAAPPDETRFQAFQRKAQDKLNRFTVIKEWLAAQGVTLSEQADVYKAEERMHSRFANKAEDFREKTVKPLVEQIQRAGYSMDDVAQYLHAQHAEERNIQVASINKQMPDGGSGMKTADANAILAAAPAELKRLANEFRAITERTKQILLDSGIISQDMADAWEATYQHYVPLKGGPEQGGKGAGKGLKANYKGKRALGHTLREEGEWIVENILADHERAIMLAEKNRIGQSLLKMAIEVGRDDLLTVGKPEKRGVLKNNTAYEVLFKGKVIGAFQSLEAARTFRATAPAAMKGASPSEFGIRKVSDPTVAYMASPMLADNEVNVYVKGQAIRVQINDDLLARAYGNMGTEALGAILRVGSTINGYFSKIYTGYNPEFILTNIVRDFTTGVANVTGEEGAMMALRAAKDYPASFADLFRYATTGNASQWIRMYREDGGNTGAAYLSDLERLGDEISTEYAAYKGVLANLKAGDVKSAVRAAGRKAFDKTLVWVERINQAGENAMRLSIYKAMIESGKSRAEAASLAKNATVNFSRNGEVGRQMNALWLFYNAGVQGTAAIAHANLKGRHKWQARAVSAGILGLGYTMAVALGAGDDEDDYDKLSDYTKARNVVIKTGDGWLKIPVPYGYGFFWNMGRAIADAERKGEWGKAPWHVASSFIEEFTPFGAAFAGDDLTLEQVTLGALPTLAQIPASVGMNRTTMGGPMYPESAFDKYQPDNEKMWRATKGTIPDMIAQALDQGGIEVSPETIKYLTRTFTGGAGQFVTSIGDAAWLTANGASLEVKEQPFVRKFYTETDVREARSAYYAAVAEAEKAVREGKSILKMGDHAAYGAYRVENQEFYALDRMAKARAAAIKARRNYADAIRADKSLSVKEKRDKLKAAEAQEQVIYDRYLEVFKSRARQ